jgi:chorismate mutase/prephenate dehydratase
MDLDDVRRKIDALDDALLDLLNERASLVAEVVAAKKRARQPFYAPERERAIVERLTAQNPGPFPTAAVGHVFQEILSACLALQSTVRVAYLGPEGTNTHAAVQRHFGLSDRGVPLGTIGRVFDAVMREDADFGVVPVESSSEGVVSHTLDAFAETDLSITAEIALPISHCLLVRPGTPSSSVEHVYSHPQALAQCRRWLSDNLRSAVPIEAPSTAAAARSARSDVTGAAIANEMAAQIYGLEILHRELQDTPGTMTRFLVIGRDQPKPTGVDRTTLMVTLDSGPGSLLRALRPISDHGVNMTRIESRPNREEAWRYWFFVELEGHREDPEVAAALSDLSQASAGVRVLGSYPRAAEGTRPGTRGPD